jgi:uridine phosphorylase
MALWLHGSMANANFPKDHEGRVYHLCVKEGEVANRVLSVGSSGRAEVLSKYLDQETLLTVASNRGFTTYTGLYKNVPVSIIATGMGKPMMDFVVREASAVVDGDMVIIRFGTCGSLIKTIPIGGIGIANESISIVRDPDAFDGDEGEDLPRYRISKPIKAHSDVVESLNRHFLERLDAASVNIGLNATADSFYSSQGRTDPNFDDENEDLINKLKQRFPNAFTLEMETFHLFDLARCSDSKKIKVGAATIILANRITNEFLDNDRIREIEEVGGEAVLDALINVPL